MKQRGKNNWSPIPVKETHCKCGLGLKLWVIEGSQKGQRYLVSNVHVYSLAGKVTS